MHISDYQIFNVLKALSRQFTSQVDEKDKGTSFSIEKNRSSVMDKIADDVIRRICRYDPEREAGGRDSEQSGDGLDGQTGLKQELSVSEFVYHILDCDGNKVRKLLSVKKTGTLICDQDT